MRFFESVLIAAALAAGFGNAQEPLPPISDDVLLNRAHLHAQLMGEPGSAPQGPQQVLIQPPTKSVARSVLFSAVLPGAGQLYAGSTWKAAMFAAIEATGWAINLVYNGKGDDKNAEHESWVDNHWSEQRYWSYVYLQVNNNEAVSGFPDGIFDPDIIDVDGKPLLNDWQDKRDLLDEYDDQLSGFTHHLPETKTQQYYEMVGKYPRQFGNAWDDASFEIIYSGYEDRMSANNRLAEDLRFDLNRLYDIAGYGSMTLLVNHLVAAIDAGFTAKRFNERQMRLSYQNRLIDGEYVNFYGLTLNW